MKLPFQNFHQNEKIVELRVVILDNQKQAMVFRTVYLLGRISIMRKKIMDSISQTFVSQKARVLVAIVLYGFLLDRKNHVDEESLRSSIVLLFHISGVTGSMG